MATEITRDSVPLSYTTRNPMSLMSFKTVNFCTYIYGFYKDFKLIQQINWKILGT